MDLPDFSSGYWFLLLTVIFFIIITGRYFLIAGLFYLLFYVWFPARWKKRKINKREYKTDQFKKEIKWSLITSIIFSFSGAITVILWQNGDTKIYTIPDQYGWWYLPVSLIVFMLLQETYYYWVHRWMHIPRVYKIAHKVHHDSKIASPFTAFSFHPYESILQAIFLPLMCIILPIHYYVIIFLLTIMSFSSVVNHLDIEIYPKKFQNGWSNWVIGATHHSLHHKMFNCNFGLYFTFWDKIKKTESPEFKEMMRDRN
jgi:sterol desaturase/sphingolipid hydroxylase (fatty acid hydroxylase superfamily)